MKIAELLEDYRRNACDMHYDGFTQFAYKQKLYQVLWQCSKELSLCPHFVGEDEWVNQQIKESHGQDIQASS